MIIIAVGLGPQKYNFRAPGTGRLVANGLVWKSVVQKAPQAA